MLILSIVLGAVVIVLSLVAVSMSSKLKGNRKMLTKVTAQNKVLFEDNNHSRRSLQELKRESVRYRELFDRTKDILLVYSVTSEGLPGLFIDANAVACKTLKYEREALLSRSMIDVETEDMPVMTSSYKKSDMVVMSDSTMEHHASRIATAQTRKLIKKILSRNIYSYNTVFEDKNGNTIPVRVVSRAFKLDGEQVIMCTAVDISEEMVAKQELSDSRHRFLEFFSNSPVGIAIYDRRKVLTDVNLACLRMFGIPDQSEFARFNLFDNPFIPPAPRERLARGESVRYEAEVNFSEAIGKHVFITSKTGVAFFDILIYNMSAGDDFKPRGYFIQVQDVSDRRHAESDLRRSEDQLRQAEKMEAIGSMAGGIAHDFNNILTPIIGYAQMLQGKFSEDEKVAKYASGILRAANRAKDLVSQILTFSRKSEISEEDQVYSAIHIIPIAKEVLVLQKTSLPEGVEIVRNIRSDKDVVLADPTKVHQVLMNLCTNAGHAMRESGGTLEFTITDFNLGTGSKGAYQDLEPGHYLRLSVKDDGTGMDSNLVDRIFEPFFTTKKKGEGTGMGLSVVHGIIKSFKGAITVESELGKGSTFHVILPTAEKLVEARVKESVYDIPTGIESILVVDDDSDVCEMTTDLLKAQGYDATGISHANGALRLFSIDPQKFRLVITDQVMPGMTGLELSRKLLELREDLPIILCTGYSQTISVEDTRAAGIKEVVTKPVSVDELGLLIRNLLDNVSSEM